ncbi:MAG: CoA ester lyase [Halioglobus sp.]
MSLRRSLLFVPGSRSERFAKAEASGADMVCIDLEDAVVAAEKDSARSAALAHLANAAPVERVIRINRVTEPEGQADLTALANSPDVPELVMLPKTESAEEVRQAVAALAGKSVGIIALIESPRGLLNALAIAEADDSVEALMFGGADFSAELGSDMSWDALLYARGQLAVVAAAAGVQLIDVPCLALKDEVALASETAKIISLGFTCKSAIHPAQIAVIHQQFMPDAQAVEKAQRIIAASETAGGGVVNVDGAMVDRPVVIAAQRTLAMADLSN